MKSRALSRGPKPSPSLKPEPRRNRRRRSFRSAKIPQLGVRLHDADQAVRCLIGIPVSPPKSLGEKRASLCGESQRLIPGCGVPGKQLPIQRLDRLLRQRHIGQDRKQDRCEASEFHGSGH